MVQSLPPPPPPLPYYSESLPLQPQLHHTPSPATTLSLNLNALNQEQKEIMVNINELKLIQSGLVNQNRVDEEKLRSLKQNYDLLKENCSDLVQSRQMMI
ncbi:hypothetical protein, partial [Pseudomonas aeruginosa]|uniref:hypothetical protein n=1 Tax=Pseudomonas aeruginosa TaxID=287 RepID=UPI001CA4E8BB